MLKPFPRFLTGSRAYGVVHSKSDFDVCVYLPEKEDVAKLYNTFAMLEVHEAPYNTPTLSIKLEDGVLNIIGGTDIQGFMEWAFATHAMSKLKLTISDKEQRLHMFSGLKEVAMFADIEVYTEIIHEGLAYSNANLFKKMKSLLAYKRDHYDDIEPPF